MDAFARTMPMFQRWMAEIEEDPVPPDIAAFRLALAEDDVGFSATLAGTRADGARRFVADVRAFLLAAEDSPGGRTQARALFARMLEGWVRGFERSRLRQADAITVGFEGEPGTAVRWTDEAPGPAGATEGT